MDDSILGITGQRRHVPVKSCKFIITDRDTIFVQRPSSWIGGWARSIWLKRYFKQGVLITGADQWNWLKEQFGVNLLIEEDGKYEVHTLEVPTEMKIGITI